MNDRSYKVWVFAILLMFLMFSIFTSFYYGERLLLGSLTEFDNDDVKYLRSAKTLIETGKFTYNYPEESTAFIMPGIVLTLVPFVKIFGFYGAIATFRIFSALIQTAILFIFYLIVKKAFDKKTGLFSILLMALYLPNVYVTTLMLTETMFLFFFSLLIYFSILGVEEKKTKYYVMGGVFWGLCALFRPTIVLYPLIIGILWIIKKYKFTEMLKFGMTTVGVFAVILSPWWVRNYITFNKFIPFTLSTGNPTLQGAFIDNKVDWELIEKLNTENLQYKNNEIVNNEVETILAKKVKEYNLENNTRKYLSWVTIGKTVCNFRYPFCWFMLYGINYNMQKVQHYIYLFFGLAGFIIAIIKDRKNIWIYTFILFILYFNCVHLPFFCFSRYVYPIMPFFAIMSSYAILNVGRRNKTNE